MSRSLTTPTAITSVFMLALAAACGHSSQTLDAYEKAKESPTSSGGSSNGGSGATGGSSATGGTDSGGTGNSGSGGTSGTSPLPQFDCSAVASQQFDPDTMKAYSVDPAVTKEVDDVLSAMGPTGWASQMIGVDVGNKDYQDIERSPDYVVQGYGTIRGYNYRDAGHGVNLDAGQKNRANDGNNFATAFPTASIRAASWDLELEKRVGEASGDETAGSKNNMLLAPCMNIIRHPYWGRTQETYSEDSYHIGRMASAYTVGLQEYVTGCAKHFAANNIEKGRSTQNAIMNEQTLREIYGRHFEMVVQDGGIGCIMASYNMINKVKDTQNKHLLNEILKAPVSQGGFGYQGLVISDWWAMPGDQNVPDSASAQSDTNEAVLAGLDIEVPWTLHYSTATLAGADQGAVKEAARRVLTQKFRFATAKDTDGWSLKEPASKLVNSSIDPATAVTNGQTHEDLAEEVELKSAVLLKNGPAGMPVLPLKTATNIAVIGPDEAFQLVSSSVPKTCGSTGRSCTYHFATDGALGDRGSSRVNGDPAHTVGPFDGIKAAAPMGVTVTSGNSADAAAAADTIVVVVGYTPGDEGEEYAIGTGGDRSTLDLPTGQNDFVNAALNLGKPTIIIIESGSIVNLPWLTHTNQNQATIWAGYPGLRGGLALGKLIFSVNGANFSGKVPLAWPTQAELDLMPFKEADTETHMGYFFGYREYDRRKAAGQTVNLVFPFGHGMSYSTYEYSNLVVPCQTATKDGIFNVKVDIKNTSAVDGDEVAMLFVKPPPKPSNITGDRPVKELKSFARITVPAGMTKTANLPLRIRDLRRWEGDASGHWMIDSGAYTILVGKDADDAEASTATQGTLMVQGD
jgi:beta-glucosidase